MNKFTFTNRDEYFAYRKAWAAEYNELSKTISERKWLTKTHQKAFNTVWLIVGSYWPQHQKFDRELNFILQENEKYQELYKRSDKKIWLEELRKIANKMNLELKEAKIEAERQYQQQKNS